MAYIPMPRQQPQGFYNPNMATPDWGAGLREMLNNFTTFKQEREQMEQQGLQNQQAQQRIDMSQQQMENLEDYRRRTLDLDEAEARKEPAMSETIAQAKILVDTGKAPDMGSAIMAIKKIQTPEAEIEEFTQKERIKAEIKNKFDTKGRGEAVAKRWERDVDYVDDGIKKYNNELKRLRKIADGLKPGDILEERMQGTEGKKNYAKVTAQIERLQNGLQEISMHKAMLQSGNPLQTNESTYVKKLIVGMNSIKEGEFFRPMKQEQPQTVSSKDLDPEEDIYADKNSGAKFVMRNGKHIQIIE